MNYNAGKVYIIYSDIDAEFYVGSTVNTLEMRLAAHKSEVGKHTSTIYRHFDRIGVHNMNIALLENFPCDTEDQLLWRERKWYDMLCPTLNDIKPIINYYELKEINRNSWKRWKDSNPERYKEYCKKQREKHSDKRKELWHEWHEQNKDNYNAVRRQRHAENREEVNEKRRQWREENKEKLREQDRAYKEKNRDAINARRRELRKLKKEAAKND